MISIQSQLRRRLLPAIILTSLALLLVASFLTAREFRESNERRMAHVAQLVLGLSASMSVTGVEPLVDRDIYDRLDVAEYLILVRKQGAVFYSSQNLSNAAELPERGSETYVFDGETYDLLHTDDVPSQTQVTVGIISSETFQSILELVAVTTLCFLVGAVVMWRIVAKAIRRALAPLEDFEAEMDARHSGNLDPLDTRQLPLELLGAGKSVNGLLDKVAKTVQQERAFVSNAAHELRTPLAGIIAQIDAIPSRTDDGAASLAKIKTAAQRSNRLITQLLYHARAHSLQDDATISSQFDLVTLVSEIIGYRMQSATEANVQISVDFEIASAPVNCPRDLLQIVIDNLIDNAVKYSATPGHVHVTLVEDRTQNEPDGGKSMWVLMVEDDGEGLSAEAFALACERFQRIGASKPDGFGLGLALVSDLCDRLDLGLSSFASDLGGLGVKLVWTSDRGDGSLGRDIGASTAPSVSGK